MSDSPEPRNPEFVSGAGHAGRPYPLSREKYQILVEVLNSVGLPVLKQTRRRLLAEGFNTVEVNSFGALIGLQAAVEYPYLQARIRVQIHDTFVPLTRPDPIFYFFSIHGAQGLVECKPGRSGGCDREILAGIAEEFVAACRSARRAANSECVEYFGDMISLGLDQSEFRHPQDCRALLELTRNEPGILRSVIAPMLELAAETLSGRFPAWRVKVSAPVIGAATKCGLSVKAIPGKPHCAFFWSAVPPGTRSFTIKQCATEGKRRRSQWRCW